MDDLEKRLKKDSEYTKEEQEFDGAVGYNLPSPKDLTNYYPPSANLNVEKYEKAILNTNGELPSKWVLDLTEEQIDELNTYSPDFVNHLSDVSNYYQDAIDVENDITETAARRTATREGWNNISNSVTGFGYAPKEGEVAKPFDYEAEFKKALDEVTQEKLGTTMAMFETEDRAMETVVNEKLPNNVQEGMLGKAWNKFKDNVSNSYRVGVYKGNQQFRPGSENIEQPEDMSMGMVSKIVITGKFGSWLFSRMLEPFNNYSEISSSEERQIQGVEQGRDLAIKQFKAVSQKETWNSAMNSSPHVANEILKLFGGDEMKAQAVFHTMTMANSPELMDANNNYMEAVFEASTEKVKKNCIW